MEPLKHECGVAMIRLLKPLEYYQQTQGTWMFGLNKLYLMMEKQHNRGQEGAGMACVKLGGKPGHEYMFRERAEGMITPIQLVFQSIEGLREAIPNHKGDWYFTGHYPTPGGTKLCNQSFVNYIENVYHQ